MSRAVIIGGGLAGLATALRLRAAHWDVTVCEAGPSFGGKMNRWQQAGYTFDTGPSLITMPWVFRETFAAAGGCLDDHIQLNALHPIAEYRFDDGTRFEYSSHLPDLLETFKRIAPHDIGGFYRFLALGAKLYELSRATFFSRTPFEPPRVSDGELLRSIPVRHGWGNYHGTVESFFRSPYLRQLYDRYPTYVGSSPYRAPATLAVIPYIEFAFGGYSVTGGLYKIIEGLLALAAAQRVELMANAPVVRILTSGGRANGVQLASGDRIAADVVVMNGDAVTTPELLGEPAQPLCHRSLSGLVFLFGIDKDLPQLQQHTVLFSADYRREFTQLFDNGQFPDDPTVYINAPSRGDRSVVPGKGETLFVMANAPGCDTVWDDARIASARAAIFARMLKAGLPDLSRNIAVSDVWTPNRIASRYLMPGGSIYGTDSHGWRNAFLRPRNAHPRVGGLYHVGGSTHPGGGTPTVLMSAAITTRLILKRECQ